MQTFPYALVYYVTEAGKTPFKEWLETLRDLSGRARYVCALTEPGSATWGIIAQLVKGFTNSGSITGPATECITPLKERASYSFCSVATSHRKREISQRQRNTGGTIGGGLTMAKGSASYQKDLVEALKDPCEAAAYLNAAIEEGDREVFLLALRNVAEANGGMGAVAAKANLSRESLYRMLSKRGNPEIKSLFTLLHTMGLRLAVEAESHVCAAG
jgi:probable addiction module antidote protein